MTICRPLPCSALKQPQQLALRLAPAREELHVVEQQHVDAAVALLEPLHLADGDRGVELLDEVLERDVLDAELRAALRRAALPIAPMRCVLPSPELL